MSKVVLSGYILVEDDDLQSILGALPEHIELTRKEVGCLRFEVSRDAENPNRFNVEEEFSSRATFEDHQVRSQSSHWGSVSRNIERHYTVKEI